MRELAHLQTYLRRRSSFLYILLRAIAAAVLFQKFAGSDGGSFTELQETDSKKEA